MAGNYLPDTESNCDFYYEGYLAEKLFCNQKNVKYHFVTNHMIICRSLPHNTLPS